MFIHDIQPILQDISRAGAVSPSGPCTCQQLHLPGQACCPHSPVCLGGQHSKHCGTGSVTGLDEALLPGMIRSSASAAVKATGMKAESGLGTGWEA